MPELVFEARGVCAGYGRGDIVSEVDVAVGSGQILTVIGPNGAGKSTFVKTLAGVLQRRCGTILIEGRDVGVLPASEIARQGVSYVPQEHNVFRSLSVDENLEIGAWMAPRELACRRQAVMKIFPALVSHRRTKAGNLSGGQRQMVAFGMALMLEPKVLLLDEPSAGLSPALAEQMFDVIRQVRDRGIAILMVEQNAMKALGISDIGMVMVGGRAALTAPAAELLRDRRVTELYLGTRT